MSSSSCSMPRLLRSVSASRVPAVQGVDSVAGYKSDSLQNERSVTSLPSYCSQQGGVVAVLLLISYKGLDTRLIQDYLGHRNIAHTTRYTRTAAARFNGLWR